MRRKRIKDCILIDCISFTCAAVILSVLAYFPDMTMKITQTEYLQLFECTTIISVLMYFTFQIQIESQIVMNLLALLDIAVVVYGIGGGIFKWFPWEFKYIAEVAVILTAIFFITNYMMIWQNREMAKAINEKIKERRA